MGSHQVDGASRFGVRRRKALLQPWEVLKARPFFGHGCAPLRWMFQGSSGEDGTIKKKAKLIEDIEGNGTEDIATMNIYES